VGLKGVQQERSISDAFDQTASGASLINVMRLDYVIGSGGILAHSPRRTQSMLMMIDAYQPEGITRMAVDSIFMMPHLGVLAQISEKAALDVFYHDCLVRLGTCLAPKGLAKEGQLIMEWEVTGSDGSRQAGELRFGDILHVPFAAPKARLVAKPVKGFDMGAGSGSRVEADIEGGVVGLVLDGRGRPFNISKEPAKRRDDLNKWYKAMGMYPV
jgi:hypothetical protein